MVADLRRRADELRRQDEEASHRAAGIVDWAGTAEGKELREWMIAFKAKQAAAPDLEKAWEQVQIKEEWSFDRIGREFDRVEEQWKLTVVSDGNGRPLEINVVEYIDQLAHLIALTKMPRPWIRRGKQERVRHLKAIRATAIELADLLEAPDGPGWPPTIELFDDPNRPILTGSVAAYLSHVKGRLQGQQLAPLLRNLAARTEVQERMDVLESRDDARPHRAGSFHRQLARRIRAWFAFATCRKSGDDICKLVTMLINASQRQASTDNEPVTVEQVKEWLRTPRRRGAGGSQRPSR